MSDREGPLSGQILRLAVRTLHLRGPARVRWRGPNFYAYVGNSPMNLVDPLGLTNCVDTVIGQVCTNWGPGWNEMEPEPPQPPSASGMVPVPLLPPTAGRKPGKSKPDCGQSAPSASDADPDPLYVLSEAWEYADAVQMMATGGIMMTAAVAAIPVGCSVAGPLGCFAGAEAAPAFGVGGYFVARTGWRKFVPDGGSPDCP